VSRVTRTPLLGLALAFVLLAAGCGGSSPTSAPPTQTGVAPPSRHIGPVPTIRVYQVLGDTLTVHAFAYRPTPDVATAALSLLHLYGTVTVANGTATVTRIPHISDQNIAALVWTLTQFPTIKRVSVPGHRGLTRTDEASYAPPILLESPLAPNPVSPTFHVTGTATVFEATLVVELQAGGKTLVRKTVTASAGAPDLGTFDTIIHTTREGPATLVLYSPSAADGSPQHEVTENIQLGR
jgi:hypothetical protein